MRNAAACRHIFTVLICAWLTAWLTVVPLFHTHIPDTTDEWSSLHSGGVHTVFTPDLPGEFAVPFDPTNQDHSGRLGQRAVNSPELGLAVFDQSDDRKGKSVVVIGTSFTFSAKLRHNAVLSIPERAALFSCLSALHLSRGPPRLISV